MILLALKDYIKQHQVVTRQALLNHFDLQSDALDGLLKPLITQGHVIETQSQSALSAKPQACASGSCGSACQLPPPTQILWCEKPLKPLPIRVQIN